MSETRTYIVPEQPQQNPNDNLAMMAMLNGNGGFGGNGMWNNPFMYLVWMWMMRWMNNGWGENGDCQNAGLSRQIQTLQEQMQDNHNSDLIMQGINGNADAIREAADKIGCNFNVLNQAVCGIRSSIDQVSGQLGFTGERIINAVNSGDCKVIEAINSCCCNTQKAIIEQGYQNQLANERQTYQITNSVEQIVKHGKKLMHCLSELESKSGEHYMERYGKRRRGGMRDSDYDDEDYPRYY